MIFQYFQSDSLQFQLFSVPFIDCTLLRDTAITDCESCERIAAGESTPIVSNTRLNFMLRCFYTVLHASILGKTYKLFLIIVNIDLLMHIVDL